MTGSVIMVDKIDASFTEAKSGQADWSSPIGVSDSDDFKSQHRLSRRTNAVGNW
jgi:hypothetical protein